MITLFGDYGVRTGPGQPAQNDKTVLGKKNTINEILRNFNSWNFEIVRKEMSPVSIIQCDIGDNYTNLSILIMEKNKA